MGKKFMVLDGSSLLYRAFYALPDLTNSLGEHTNAIHGFSKMLLKLKKEWAPDLLLIAFDKSKKTFRTEMFAEYKGTRKKTPEELREQIPLLHEFAEGMGIVLLEKEGYEADDIIGTLATRAVDAGWESYVVTGDRDALQLVREGLTVLLTRKGITEVDHYTPSFFAEAYDGLAPQQLIDLKALMGDASDNIPGVAGIGIKTATKFLQEYGTLENLYEHVEEISSKRVKNLLIEQREAAFLSKRLATIDCSVPGMEFEERNFAAEFSAERMQKFCDRYELSSLRKELQSELVADTTKMPAYVSLTKGQLTKLKKAKSVTLSAMFSGKAPFLCVEALIFVQDGEIAVTERGAELFEEAISLLALPKTWALLSWKNFLYADLPLENVLDLSLLDYLLRPEQAAGKIADIYPYFSGETAFHEFSSDLEETVYEAYATAQIAEKAVSEVKEKGMWTLYEEVERPLVPVLVKMEKCGIFINRNHLMEKSKELATLIDGLQHEIYALAGKEFNVNSTKQLGKILFEELQLPVGKKTKTGYSTNVEVLEGLLGHHPIIEKILSYRTWTKLKSTYVDGIGDLIEAATDRVHTTFNQTVTATGRLSSSNPNLQNIPVRTEEGRTIRALFEPGEGYDALLSADYSQIELRLLAHMSGDEAFIDAFVKNQDIHARTAAEVFGIPIEEVTADLRRKAKAVNFGIVYGISDFGLARDLHIPKKEAAEYIALYFERYPKVKRFLDGMVEKAHKDGFVTTLFGRRRTLPAIKSKNFNQRSFAERMAMNTPIQGTAADVIKKAMIRVDDEIRSAGLKSRILLQVHDELVLEAVTEEIPTLTMLLQDAMENAVKLSVPLTIDIHEGKNWAEAK